MSLLGNVKNMNGAASWSLVEMAVKNKLGPNVAINQHYDKTTFTITIIDTNEIRSVTDVDAFVGRVVALIEGMPVIKRKLEHAKDSAKYKQCFDLIKAIMREES